MRVHILTEGYVTPNVRAFFFPMIMWRRALRAYGVEWRIFHGDHPALCDCDALLVEGKAFGDQWKTDPTGVVAQIAAFGQRVEKLFFLDSTDSTAVLYPQVLPYVTRYFKGQLLRDRALYGDSHYGYRLYTDHSHRQAGVVDTESVTSTAITDPALRDKLAVWTNSALADYSLFGKYRMEIFRRIPLAQFLSFPSCGTCADGVRPYDVSCRMGTTYGRETVAWYRKSAKKILRKWAQTDKVTYPTYVREMRQSKVVVSPFGWGEINYKDFETFLSGAALLKPNMEHMETWPDLYRTGETYEPYDWSGADIVMRIEELLDKPRRRIEMAQAAQTEYLAHISGEKAPEAYGDRISSLLAGI